MRSSTSVLWGILALVSIGLLGVNLTPSEGSCASQSIVAGQTEIWISTGARSTSVNLEPDEAGAGTGTVIEFYTGCTSNSNTTGCPVAATCWNDFKGVEHCFIDGNATTVSRGTILSPGGNWTRALITANGASDTIKPKLTVCNLGT